MPAMTGSIQLARKPKRFHYETMNITIKDLPPEVHARLRTAAKRSGRSLNKQIVTTLEHAVSPVVADRTQLLQRVRQRREGMALWLQDADIEQARLGGRM
jgi:hypothetical protein